MDASPSALQSTATQRRLVGLRLRARDERGQQLAELAFILSMLLIILFGAVDLGRAFHTYIGLTNGAREAARFAAVNNATASSSQVTQELNPTGGSFTGCVGGSLIVTAPNVATIGRGNPYTVTVSCKFQLVTPLIGLAVGADANNRITISSTATFVID